MREDEVGRAMERLSTRQWVGLAAFLVGVAIAAYLTMAIAIGLYHVVTCSCSYPATPSPGVQAASIAEHTL